MASPSALPSDVASRGSRTEVRPTAAAGFAVDRDVSEPNGGHAIKFKGTLTPADDQGRLRLTFDATVHHANATEGIEATFTLTGSALLMPGKQKTLGVLGEAALKVTAVEEE